MAIRILPYNMASESANALASALHCRLINNNAARSKYVPSTRDFVINWGHITPWVRPSQVGLFFNVGVAVHNVSNKLRFFQTHNENFNHPQWTTDRSIVRDWLRNGSIVFARHELAASEGAGIQILKSLDVIDIPEAPLYTKYIPKAAEYRVHVFDCKIISIQQKIRREGLIGDFLIRNHNNGFIFARNVGGRPVIETVPPCVLSEALTAVLTADLDFGGVDVIYNRRLDKAFVLEINSAPGIEGSTINAYAVAIAKSHFENREHFDV